MILRVAHGIHSHEAEHCRRARRVAQVSGPSRGRYLGIMPSHHSIVGVEHILALLMRIFDLGGTKWCAYHRAGVLSHRELLAHVAI